jgi:multidrug efflux pump subunit AcrA (membrane-fusion protein)
MRASRYHDGLLAQRTPITGLLEWDGDEVRDEAEYIKRIKGRPDHKKKLLASLIAEHTQGWSPIRQRLSDLATTPEQQQVFASSAVQAKAAFEAAQQQEAQAEINLRRTQVRSPVNGYVTNLQMRVGDYAHQAVSISRLSTPTAIGSTGTSKKPNWRGSAIGDRVGCGPSVANRALIAARSFLMV